MMKRDDDWTGAPLDQVVRAARRGSEGARREWLSRARQTGLDLAVSPGGRPIDTSSLDRSPKKNWVEERGGLPPYVRGIARGIARTKGHPFPTSRDIAMAIAAVHRWARGGDNVKPAVQAAAAKAVARWTAMKAGGSTGPDLATEQQGAIDFAVWQEHLHPRDHRGRFSDKVGLAKALIRAARVPSVKDRAKKTVNGIDITKPITYTNPNGKKTVPPKVTEAIRERMERHPVDAANIVAMYEKTSSDEERELGKDWYPNASRIVEALAAEHGVSRVVVAGLIANYSPQKPWGQNLIEAAEALRLGRAIGGKGNKDNPLSGKGIMATDEQAARGEQMFPGSAVAGITLHPEDVLAPQWVGANLDKKTGTFKVNKKTGETTPQRKAAGQALKIRNFFRLVLRGGDDESVVVDRHAYGVARGVAMTEAEYTTVTPSSDVLYDEAADAYREAARQISVKVGRHVTPSEVQATTWLTRQRLNKGASSARETLGLQDSENLRKYVEKFYPHLEDVFFGGGAVTGYGLKGYLNLAFAMLDDMEVDL